jgi:hypothetical protein
VSFNAFSEIGNWLIVKGFVARNLAHTQVLAHFEHKINIVNWRIMFRDSNRSRDVTQVMNLGKTALIT